MNKLIIEKEILKNKKWEFEPLGNIITAIKGKKPKNLGNQNKEFPIPYITIESFEKKIFKKFTDGSKCIRCFEDDVLLVWDGARSGLVGSGVSGIVGSTLMKLISHGINKKYLYYFLKLNYDILNKNTKGIGIPHINPTVIWNLTFPIPPLNEQTRIVERIEELFSKINLNIENITKVVNQLSIYRLSLLYSAFTVDATKEILLDCGEIGTGGTPSRAKPEYYGGKFPWVKTTEVRNSVIYETGEKITQSGLDNSNAKIYPKNSIILAMYGDGKTRGQCSILGIPASTNQACAVVVCDPQKLFYKYCFYWLQSQYYQVRRKSSGGNQQNLNLGIVKKFKIPLPDIPTQEEIVTTIEIGVSQIDNLKDKSTTVILYLQNMKNAILKLAFEGKLVPQDLNDEPAEILLQKIKQEKEQLKQKSKKRMKNGR